MTPEKVLILKTTDHNRRGHGGFKYPESGPVECPDWKPEPTCANGLFGLAWGLGNTTHFSDSPGANWLIIAAEPSDVIRVDEWGGSGDGKVKFRRGEVVHCGDRDTAIQYLVDHAPEGQETIGHGDSDAIALLKLVWDRTEPGSWSRLNAAMQSALKLAIEAHMEFYPWDFKRIQGRFNAGYWIGQDGGYGERWYALACTERHVTACKSFELWKGRKPFRWDGERVYVGRRFKWAGLMVACTSMDAESFVVCSYKDTSKSYERKIDKRLRITRDDLKAASRRKAG